MVIFSLLESYLIVSIVKRFSIVKNYCMIKKTPSGFITPAHAYGYASFMTILDDLTAMQPAKIKQICVWLGICEKTMKRYISEASPIPPAVCYALFFESKWGRDSLDVDVINNRQMLVMQISVLNSKCRALESENVRLSNQIVNTSHAANAPTFSSGMRVLGTGKDIHSRAAVRDKEEPVHPFHEFKTKHCRSKR